MVFVPQWLASKLSTLKWVRDRKWAPFPFTLPFPESEDGDFSNHDNDGDGSENVTSVNSPCLKFRGHCSTSLHVSSVD